MAQKTKPPKKKATWKPKAGGSVPSALGSGGQQWSPSKPSGLSKPSALQPGSGKPAAPANPLAALAGAGVSNPYQVLLGVEDKDYTDDMGYFDAQESAEKATLNFQFFDPANPYSKAAEQLRAEQIARKANMNAQNQSGHLFGGAMISSENAITHEAGLAKYGMQQQYNEMLSGIVSKYHDKREERKAQNLNTHLENAGQLAGDPSNTPVPAAGAPTPASGGSKKPGQAGYAAQVLTFMQTANGGKPLTVAQSKTFAKAIAQELFGTGEKTGKRWRTVIDTLGYDPRKGGKLVFK